MEVKKEGETERKREGKEGGKKRTQDKSQRLVLLHHKGDILGDPVWLSRLRVQHCHFSSLGCCCGAGLIPGLGISTCHRCGQKKKSGKSSQCVTMGSLGSLEPQDTGLVLALLSRLKDPTRVAAATAYIGCSCGSDLIPGPVTPYATWRPKMNK